MSVHVQYQHSSILSLSPCIFKRYPYWDVVVLHLRGRLVIANLAQLCVVSQIGLAGSRSTIRPNRDSGTLSKPSDAVSPALLCRSLDSVPSYVENALTALRANWHQSCGVWVVHIK